MNGQNDWLKAVDFDSAFAATPVEIDIAVMDAGRRIRRRKKNLARAACAAAAVVVAAVGVSALMLGRQAHRPEDIVLAQPTANPADVREVWTSRRDLYYHADANCGNILVPKVKMQRATALEFEKTPCPACEEGNK